MKILKNHTISKKEDVMIIPFLEFLYSDSEEISFTAVLEDENKRPDYFVDSTNTLIEVKEIHDKESNQKHALWGKIASRLQKAVDRNNLLSQVNGTYLVNTPERFKSPTDQEAFDTASNQVIQAIIENKKTVKVFGVEFEVNKVSEQESVVVFGSSGGGSSIDPSNIVYENIKDKLESANKQLNNPPPQTKPSTRIVLLVNKYYFPLWNWDLFKAIARTYEDLISFNNIDEIWYQFETKDEGFIHKLLYRKSFFKQFKEEKFTTLNNDDYQLFANWFSALSDMGDEQKQKLLVALKYFLKDKKPYEIFPDTQTRQDVVRFGLWLAEKELFNELVWFVDKFMDDPDPAEPKNFTSKERFNLHQEIIENKDSNTITTVLGHLAWVIQKLAVNKNYIVKAFELTKKLLRHKNLYIKLQSLIPFIEISVRRQWLEEYDQKNNTELYKEFRLTAFSLLENYTQYKAIADSLTRVFYYFKDITTIESLEVLDKLSNTREAAVLYVYFGIYRERHYKDKVEFDPKLLQKKLKETIVSKNENKIDLQGSITWNFWKILADTPDEFDTIKPYLDLFFKQSYNKKYYNNLERIIEEWIERKPDICTPWFISSINKLHDYIGNNEAMARNIWISPETGLQFIAIHEPLSLIDVVGKLINIWKLGAFIGNPKDIFDTFKLVKNPKMKSEVIKKYKQWYLEMKIVNPKLQDVSWN